MNKSKYNNYIGRLNNNPIYRASVCGHIVLKPETKNCRLCSDKIRSGFGGPRWLGGNIVDQMGYTRIYIGRLNGHSRYELEHRAVAERAIGRKLKSNEIVHHINMDKTDNRHKNLLVCSQSYHRWLESDYAKRFAKEKFGDI